MNDLAADHRASSIRQALGLEWLTIGWNVVEGVVAVAAALVAGSVALLGFGIDSFVESASGAVLVWRLLAERRGMDPEEVERLDARAHKLVGATLFLLAAYISVDAAVALWNRDEPRASVVGIALTVVSIVAMQWLARAKQRAAARLGSRALEADAFQTTACFWLSVITLVGIGLNGAFGAVCGGTDRSNPFTGPLLAEHGSLSNCSSEDVFDFPGCSMSLGGAIGYDNAGLDEEVMRRCREAVIAFSSVTSVQARADVTGRVRGLRGTLWSVFGSRVSA